METNPKTIRDIICQMQAVAATMKAVYCEHAHLITGCDTLVAVYILLQDDSKAFRSLVDKLIACCGEENEQSRNIAYGEWLQFMVGEDTASAIIRGEWLYQAIEKMNFYTIKPISQC